MTIDANTPTPSSGPDFSHGGEFIQWDDEASALDEHFPPLIDIAAHNIGADVELVRWSPDDAVADKVAAWWIKQRAAIRRHIGSVPGVKVTTRSRMHQDLGVKIGYVRFNRTRPQVVRDEVVA